MSDLARLTEDELRARLAELQHAADGKRVDFEGLQRAVHDLEVHRVELEMQNRALREVQGSLEASHQRYVDLFELAPVTCCVLDARGRLSEVNLAGTALFGAPRDALLDRPLATVVDLEDHAGFVDHLECCARARATRAVEVSFATQRRSRITTLMICAPIVRGADVVGFRVILLDVTERRRADDERRRLLDDAESARAQAEEATRLKDLFLATISHELRTPLAALLMWEEVLRAPASTDSDRARALDAIHESAITQAQLVEHLLEIARSVGGKLALDATIAEIAPIVAAAVEATRSVANARGVSVELRDGSAGVEIPCDPFRVRQVVTNLLANAIQFSQPGGSVQVLTSLHGDHVEIRVSDTGRGIAAEDIPKLFAPFTQLERVRGGMGLGLAVVKQLVDLHGGTVRAESRGPGFGTTFVVSLPTAIAPAGVRAASKPTELPGDPVRLRGLHILVVDDDPSVRDGLAIVLQQADASVDCATNALEALALLAARAADAIVTDLSMPGGDGYVLLHEVRSLRNPRLAATPIIALSAHGPPKQRDSREVPGFDVCLGKPVDAWQVLRALAGVTDRAART